MSEKQYAHVVNGELREYPLTEEIIRNRGLPLSMFTEVTYDVKPVVPAFHRLTEQCVMKMGKPTIVYTVYPMTLGELLVQANGSQLYYGPGMGEETPVYINEVDPALVGRVLDLVVEHVQGRLDEFAKTRRYDNIATVVTYRGSQVPSFAAEAERAFELRDACWTSLYAFLAQMQDEVSPAPIPRSVGDIDALLPALEWEVTEENPVAETPVQE